MDELEEALDAELSSSEVGAAQKSPPEPPASAAPPQQTQLPQQTEPAQQTSQLPSVPAAPAGSAQPQAPNYKDVPAKDLPTSQTHKNEYMTLQRIATGPRARAAPQLCALWNGSTEDKRRALYHFLQNDTNLEACEASFTTVRRKLDRMHAGRKWLTIGMMVKEGFSECLVSTCDRYVACLYIVTKI